ncbi:type II secretion system protein [uncultured Cellulomonas sp.]|uniref:PulJ/GspJ family protein n=1 Tax=uncultured Cellulomonas sp. TaxID=189682 RepID=UPI0028EAA9D2|nr:type II secretion system protein [uncultured Cellulomonas sp.]
MRELRRVLRARLDADGRRDAGWTLVELIVSMGIFGLLLALVFSILVTVSMQTKDNLARTRAVDETQIGLMQIDRQVRSGNVIADPANESAAMSGVAPYYALRVYTQTDGVFQCVQWRVRFPTGSSFGVLEYRSWKPTWQSTGGVEAWRTVARSIVKPATSTVVAADRSTWPPFFVQANDAEISSSAQTIRVTLRVKDPAQRASSAPATVTSTLTGRNTIFGYPADTCSPVPAP